MFTDIWTLEKCSYLGQWGPIIQKVLICVSRVQKDKWELSESEVAQSCLTLCDPMDYSLQGSSVHGTLQARILEWVAISFSRGSSRPRDQTWVSRTGGRRFLTSEPPVRVRVKPNPWEPTSCNSPKQESECLCWGDLWERLHQSSRGWRLWMCLPEYF